MNNEISNFLSFLAAGRRGGLFNPWGEQCNHDLIEDAAAQRLARLKSHLMCTNIKGILVGEAPGYQGARYSGCAFTSERLLLAGSIPRIASLHGQRLTDRVRPYSEPSATIVWRTLYDLDLAESCVLWNACPFHPMGGSPLSNRTPTDQDLAYGLIFLEQFLALYPGARVVAVGKKALINLQFLGHKEVACVRHPSMGGARAFREGISWVFA